MSYDDWKLAAPPVDTGDTCTHFCHNGHPMFEHDLFDAGGRIPDACEVADEAQPLCDACSEWIDRLVNAISSAALLADDAL